MRLLVLILVLGVVTVWGFPERRVQKRSLNQQSQDKRGKPREVQRDCKPKCGPTANIAQKAAAEAQAARAAQNAAGAQAAHMVKTQLAEKALHAARAAEAALAGKQAVLEQLRQEVKEAEAVVAENTAAIHQQQNTVRASVEVAREATAQHKLMVQATQLSAQLEKLAHRVLEKTKLGLQEKCRNLAEARSRLAQLQHKLQCACADCAATKQAAQSACEAARAACGNARRKKHVTEVKNTHKDSKNER